MPTKNNKKIIYSLLITCTLLAIALLILEFSPKELLFRLGKPMLRLLLFIFIGLAAGQIMEAYGWTSKLACLARPVFIFTRLGEHCAASFVSAFFSGVTANAMLENFYQEKKISRKQLFASNLINQFPAYFLHLPSTFFIVMPLTGKAGLIYFILTFSALILRTSAVALYCRFNFKSQPNLACIEQVKNKKAKNIIASLQKKLLPRFFSIFSYVLPIYVAVFVVNALGGFVWLRSLLSSMASLMPIDSLSMIVVSFIADFTSGFATAGALMHEGLITAQQTALALLIGNIIAFPVRALRHQLPRYMGIFSPGTGLQLIGLGQGLRIVSLTIVGMAYYWIG